MKFVLIGLISFWGFCTNPTEPTIKEVNIKESNVNWTGRKVLGSHTGNISIKSGALEFENDQLVGGEFMIDMRTITVTDLSGDKAKNLTGHLSSPDFFNIAEFPTSNFKITKVTSRGSAGDYKITGDLTIKGITNSITFNAMLMKENMASATTQVDRSLYDIKYGSGSFFDGLGDKTIYDEFEITVNLVMK